MFYDSMRAQLEAQGYLPLATGRRFEFWKTPDDGSRAGPKGALVRIVDGQVMFWNPGICHTMTQMFLELEGSPTRDIVEHTQRGVKLTGLSTPRPMTTAEAVDKIGQKWSIADPNW